MWLLTCVKKIVDMRKHLSNQHHNALVLLEENELFLLT